MKAPEAIGKMRSALQGIAQLHSVGTVTDLNALKKAPPATQRPAAWLVLETERAASDTRYPVVPGQVLVTRVALVLCVIPNPAKQTEIIDLIETTRKVIFALDWQEPPVFAEGALMRLAPGELWWKDTWKITTHLL